MQVFRDMGQRFAITGALLSFFWRRKMWWILPLVFVLAVSGLLIVFGTTSGLGPFIYVLF